MNMEQMEVVKEFVCLIETSEDADVKKILKDALAAFLIKPMMMRLDTQGREFQ
jgi:hypothetical protein